MNIEEEKVQEVSNLLAHDEQCQPLITNAQFKSKYLGTELDNIAEVNSDYSKKNPSNTKESSGSSRSRTTNKIRPKSATYSGDHLDNGDTITSSFLEGGTRKSIHEIDHYEDDNDDNDNNDNKDDNDNNDNNDNNNNNNNNNENDDNMSKKSKSHSKSSIPKDNNGKSQKKSKKSYEKNKGQHAKSAQTWTDRYTSQELEETKGNWNLLMNVEQLKSLKIINNEEYKERKRKLIDNLTGTRVNDNTKMRFENAFMKAQIPHQKRILGEIEIVKDIPKWDEIESERAIRYICYIDPTTLTEQWSQEIRMIKLASNPFDNGTLRYVYYMLDCTDSKNPLSNLNASHTLVNPPPATHVAKIAIDPEEEKETYFNDVAMQKHAQRFADMFNKLEVPKPVGFLDCWVYELVDRTPHIFCGVEKYIEGDYNKYTNNWDWVNDAVERNTPQSFSHYTYEASQHKILICDLQGVSDLYTDPQMHTYDGKGCGKGNMGLKGIDKFLQSHRCNALCRYLKLPLTNSKNEFVGTLPSKRYMTHDTIDTVAVVSTQYTVPDTTINSTLVPREQNNTQLNYFPPRVQQKESTKCFCCTIL